MPFAFFSTDQHRINASLMSIMHCEFMWLICKQLYLLICVSHTTIVAKRNWREKHIKDQSENISYLIHSTLICRKFVFQFIKGRECCSPAMSSFKLQKRHISCDLLNLTKEIYFHYKFFVKYEVKTLFYHKLSRYAKEVRRTSGYNSDELKTLIIQKPHQKTTREKSNNMKTSH